jgi:tetratricopeptide (TPR) repeat protein
MKARKRAERILFSEVLASCAGWAVMLSVLSLPAMAAQADGAKLAYEKGKACLEKNDYDAALAALTEAIRLDPKYVDAFISRGACKLAKGDRDGAIADYNAAVDADPKSAAAHAARGWCYAHNGDLDKAISEYSEAIRLEPHSSESYSHRAWAYYQKNEFDKAIVDANEAIRLGDNSAETLGGRASAYHSKGDYDKAIADYNAAILLNAKDSQLYTNRGGTYERKGDYDKAVSDYSTALRLNPDLADAYHRRGVCFAQRGDLDKALGDFTNAVRLEPSDAGTRYDRGLAYVRKHEYKKAIADYTETIRLDPKNAAAYENRAGMYEVVGERDKAIADLDAALKISPRTFSYLEDRATLRIRSGDYEGGMADLKAAVALDADDPAAKFEAYPKNKLSGEEIEHGKRQVRQMLHDRPAMDEHGEKAAALIDWAARKFAGEDLRREIAWDATEPLGFNSDNNASSNSPRIKIRIRKSYLDGTNRGKPQSFEEMWYLAVFELYNITSAEDFNRLNEEAFQARLTRDAYVTAKVNCESRAAEKTRAFYICVFLPWAAKYRVPTNPQMWYIACRSDCKENLMLTNVDKKSRYWTNYEWDYDQMAVDALIEKGEAREALAAAAKLLKRAADNEKKARAYYCMGGCFLVKDDYNPAVGNFSEAIRLNPNDAYTNTCRGFCYLQLQKYDKAIADYTTGLRLDPKNEKAYYYRGTAHIGNLEFDEAIADFSEAVRLNPKYAFAYGMRGRAYFYKPGANIDKAIADYNEALRLNARLSPEAYTLRATAYEKKGDKVKAAADRAMAEKLRQEAPPAGN